MKPIIDAHAHLFNYRHLPIEGIIQAKLLASGSGSKTAHSAARLFNEIILEIAKDKPTASIIGSLALQRPTSRRLAHTIIDRTALRRLEHAGGRAMLKRVGAAPTPERARVEFEGFLKEDDWSQLLHEVDRFLVQHAAASPRAPTARTALPDPTLGASPHNRRKLWGHIQDSHRDILGDFFEWLEEKMEDGIDILHFIMALLDSVDHLYKRLNTTYSPNKVSGFVNLMMDMELAYTVDAEGEPLAHPPASPRLTWREQIDEMVELGWKAKGRLFGFVAFDPRRPHAMDEVRRALELGMVGVKIYPPMGYWALDDRWKSELRELYAYCESHGIPVLTHCSPVGFEAWPGHGVYAAPAAKEGQDWEAVLNEFPHLRLCLGHSGAGHSENYLTPHPTAHANKIPYPGWYDEESSWNDEHCYAAQVTRLCADPHFKHTYGDLSYFTRVIHHADERAHVIGHLERLLQGEDGPRLATRLMYGSDWHMPAALNKADDLLTSFQNMLAEHGLDGWSTDFFRSNALRWLNLGGAAARLRASCAPLSDRQEATLAHWERLAASV